MFNLPGAAVEMMFVFLLSHHQQPPARLALRPTQRPSHEEASSIITALTSTGDLYHLFWESEGDFVGRDS
ncbi:hypothetical protein D9611_006398 [Ephemerocybe angulata]|uniref:Uncharacterized protein n=1 Tax=Ephemerocybe angulata TaxID=980116 RepID=A0A8H5C6E5_9AGAR|nr:hypothetical protein D9611_006398 [Tulosesus angulatus]